MKTIGYGKEHIIRLDTGNPREAFVSKDGSLYKRTENDAKPVPSRYAYKKEFELKLTAEETNCARLVVAIGEDVVIPFDTCGEKPDSVRGERSKHWVSGA